MGRIAFVVLVLLGALNLGRGGVHFIAPEWAAATIAGFDLSNNGADIVFLLASIGIMQMANGAIDFAVALRWRDAMAPLLALETLKQALFVYTGTIHSPPAEPVPGTRFAFVVLAAVAIGLVAALLDRRKKV